MPPPESLLSALREQRAPESHIERLTNLVELAECDPRVLAISLVGSYAKRLGDRMSDLDLVVISAPKQANSVLHEAHKILARSEVLNQFQGTHAADGAFWKLVYLDFSSVELHVFESQTKFRLKRPYLTVWDPTSLLKDYVVDGLPVRHEEFPGYQYGDDGLIWELVDCIKWLSRGQNELARSHLEKIVAAFPKHRPIQ